MESRNNTKYSLFLEVKTYVIVNRIQTESQIPSKWNCVYNMNRV